MRHTSLAAALPCPIARTLDLVGEWWSLVIVRDALLGAHRFEEFKAAGIADNILAARLKKLTKAGILKKRQYQKRPSRYEYLLTEKGRALAPAIVALRAWGRRYTSGADLSDIRHEACGHEIAPAFYCTGCDRAVRPQEVTAARRSVTMPGEGAFQA
jgi:DNA-binding HxlR family transcriptional regulator